MYKLSLKYLFLTKNTACLGIACVPVKTCIHNFAFLSCYRRQPPTPPWLQAWHRHRDNQHLVLHLFPEVTISCYSGFHIHNINTSTVLCYYEHKTNFHIHFSMKPHTWRMSWLFRWLFWIPPCCVLKTDISLLKLDNFEKSINTCVRMEF